jgi:hypothetical protein
LKASDCTTSAGRGLLVYAPRVATMTTYDRRHSQPLRSATSVMNWIASRSEARRRTRSD